MNDLRGEKSRSFMQCRIILTVSLGALGLINRQELGKLRREGVTIEEKTDGPGGLSSFPSSGLCTLGTATHTQLWHSSLPAHLHNIKTKPLATPHCYQLYFLLNFLLFLVSPGWFTVSPQLSWLQENVILNINAMFHKI